tara:strand:- start:3426 stop:3812 length:387 start_codon:yes stop_codon:yes gene_type:complete
MIVELLGSGVTEGVVSTNPKRFTCLLSQTGTNAPTTNILENTLGLTFTASYSFIGGYTFNITSTPLVTGKYTSLIGSNYSANNNNGIITFPSNILFFIETRQWSNIGGASVLTDSVLNNTMIEILQYD